jgi:glycosyltransferase involved in cell wall biosynthesis
MIARNEEKNIAKSLSLLRPHFAEIVVVDTGSSDQTLVLASEFADKVCRFDWNDDFSAARNFSLTHALNDWVLVVDCDEFLEEIDVNGMEKMINSYPEGIGMIIRHNPYESDTKVGSVERGGALATERVGRLFDRRIHHYQGIIHEQVARRDGAEPQYFPIPLSFRHEGYLTKKTAEEKARRNLALLLHDLKINGASPYTYFQLGQSYTVLDNAEEACRYYGLGLEFDLNPAQEYVRTMVEAYGYSLLKLKRFEEALQFENIYDAFATRADFPFLMGLIYMNNAKFPQAIAEFEKATAMTEFAVEGVNGYSAFYNIGVIYECLGDKERAREYYKKCGDYEPALARL